MELVKGNIAVDVEVCNPFSPAIFDTKKPQYKFIADLDTTGRRNLLATYKGLIIKGTVVMSRAIREGISTTKGALQGEKIVFFVPQGTASCESFRSKRITGMISEKCCNGTADAPCLLGSGLALSDIKVTGDAIIGASLTKAPVRKPHTQIYMDAQKKYSEKKYKEAITLYEKAEAANDMDVTGLFHIGFAYRALENCALAKPPLQKIWALQQANRVWVDEELNARRGIFLLARCHAKSGDPSGAIFYLNAFLLDPKKYRSELQQSLKHKDFGWIHTSKEYVDYKAEAERKLSRTN